MKKSVLFFTLFIFCVTSFSQDRSFQIEIIQNDKIITPQNGIVKLEKKPFKIGIKLTNLEGVYLYAAFADSMYNLKHDEPISHLKDMPSMAMAEENFNPDQELIIQDESYSFWFYNPQLDWHRLDKNSIRVDGKTVNATKTIKQFYFPGKDVLKIENVKQPLYLFFVSLEEDADGEPVKDLERYKLKLDWNH